MEKRAILAFSISIAVLFFWQYYFGLYQPITPPQQQTSSAPATPPPAAPPTPTQSAEGLPVDRLITADGNYKTWTVESPLYQTQVLAPGARLGSFKLSSFRTEVSPDSATMELVPTAASGYVPLAVDLMQHQDWQISTRHFTSEEPEKITVPKEGDPKVVEFSTEIPGKVRVTKQFSFIPGSYSIDLELRIRNLAEDTLVDQLGLSMFFKPYGPAKDETSYNISQFSAYQQKGGLSTFTVKDLAKKETSLKAPLDWVAYENNYFIQALMPLESEGYQVVPRVLDAEKGLLQVVYLTDVFQVPAGAEKSVKLRMYYGPKELTELSKAEHNLSKSVDYGWFTFIAKPLLYFLKWLYGYVHNYGVAIIILTVLIKLLFWPLTQKSFKSMQNMKKVQPKIQAIRDKYKDDKEKMNQELMAVYKTYKVNPAGGCLPMVLQIPVFFALYRMLNGAIELRHEPFMLWINDLTAPDRLWIGFDIPYLGHGLPVLTILMGISMFIQQKMTPAAGDPRQQQIMMLMPVVFTVFFINFPAGLVLYWLVNNVLSIAQQYWVNRQEA